MNIIIQWIDVIWLPLAWLVVGRDQRLWAVGTVIACMVMMRLLTELAEGAGYPNGVFHLLSLPVAGRGQIVYCFFYMVYLLYAHFLRSTGAILMAASLAIFFASMFTFAIVMVL